MNNSSYSKYFVIKTVITQMMTLNYAESHTKVWVSSSLKGGGGGGFTFYRGKKGMTRHYLL